MSTTILESQIDCYEKSLGAVADGDNPNREQLEEAIVVGAAFLRALVMELEALHAQTKGVSREQYLEEARIYYRCYQRIATQLNRLHEIVSRVRSSGVRVRGVTRLDQA